MSGAWPAAELPNLTNENCVVTSPAARRYNCIAWAAGEDFRWWWPDPMQTCYWPDVPRAATMQSFEAAYQTLGYVRCGDGAFEKEIEKIVLFGGDSVGEVIPTHAARQLGSGKWSSKLGPFEDVSHDFPEDVSGPAYGKVVLFMSRPRPNDI